MTDTNSNAWDMIDSATCYGSVYEDLLDLLKEGSLGREKAPLWRRRLGRLGVSFRLGVRASRPDGELARNTLHIDCRATQGQLLTSNSNKMNPEFELTWFPRRQERRTLSLN